MSTALYDHPRCITETGNLVKYHSSDDVDHMYGFESSPASFLFPDSIFHKFYR